MFTQLRKLSILSMLMITCSAMTAPGAAQDEIPTAVVIFGDSIALSFNSQFSPTDGLGQENYGWSGLFLDEILETSNRPTVILNFGAGATPSGPSQNPTLSALGRDGVSRILNSLAIANANHSDKDRYVLILYGTNDFGFGISPSITRAYIRTIIDRSIQSGFIPIVGNLIPRSDRDVTPYNTQIQAAAADRGVRFVDHYSNFFARGGFSLLEVELSRITNQPVRVHPTNAGYRVIAQHWFDAALAGLIEELSDAPIMAPILLLLEDDEA